MQCDDFMNKPRPFYEYFGRHEKAPSPEGRARKGGLNQNADEEGQKHKADGEIFRHSGELGIPALRLIFGEEGIGAAGDGAGEAGSLTGLKQNNDGQNDTGNHLNDGEYDGKRSHRSSFLSSPVFSEWAYLL